MGTIQLFIYMVVTGIIIGGTITRMILNKAIERKRDFILKETMERADEIKRDKILQAKEKFLQLKNDHDNYIRIKNEELNAKENQLKQEELSINQRIKELIEKQKEIGDMNPGLAF